MELVDIWGSLHSSPVSSCLSHLEIKVMNLNEFIIFWCYVFEDAYLLNSRMDKVNTWTAVGYKYKDLISLVHDPQSRGQMSNRRHPVKATINQYFHPEPIKVDEI